MKFQLNSLIFTLVVKKNKGQGHANQNVDFVMFFVHVSIEYDQ